MYNTTWCTDLNIGQASIVIVGDSLSSGQGATTYDKSWPARLSRIFNNISINNIARNGAQTKDYLSVGQYFDLLAPIRSTKPSLIINALGANEYMYDQDPQIYRRSTIEFIDWVRTNTRRTNGTWSTVLLAHTHGFNSRLVSSPKYIWADYGRVQWEIAKDRYTLNVRWLDMAPILPWLGSNEANELGWYHMNEPVPVHINNAGHAAVCGIYAGRLGSC